MGMMCWSGCASLALLSATLPAFGAVDTGTTSADSQASSELHRHLALGGQWFFLQDKVMPGVLVRGGSEWFWGHLETSLLFATESSTSLETPMMASQIGPYFSISPLHLERAEVHVGIGGDFYWLWGIHGDQWEVALSTRLSGHYWLTAEIGVFASVRWYPVASEGLQLGTTRDGESGLPLLASLGLEWRPK